MAEDNVDEEKRERERDGEKVKPCFLSNYLIKNVSLSLLKKMPQKYLIIINLCIMKVEN